jgi:chondroitin 4-sulfotransferase 11
MIFKWRGIGRRDQESSRQPPVIVLHERRAMYFPIQKVANSSWKRICAEILGLDTSDRGPHAIRFPTLPLDEVHRHADYFRFCFVRNPWDRVVSCYVEKIKTDPGYTTRFFRDGVFVGFIPYGVFRAGMSFQSFVEAIAGIPDEEADRHFRSQHTFVTDARGELLVNFVGKLEQSAEDFAHVLRRLGRDPSEVPHLNRSDHSDYKSFYTPRTMELVRQRYERDITLFGYDFAGPISPTPTPSAVPAP